jgi:hypothetical protein
MKSLLQKVSLSAARIEKRHIQMVLYLAALSLLVLGAGAPGMNGGGGW